MNSYSFFAGLCFGMIFLSSTFSSNLLVLLEGKDNLFIKPNAFRLSSILVVSIVSDTIGTLMFTCRGCAFIQFMLASAVRIFFLSFTIAMLIFELAISEAPSGH